jgi:uncharacterized protein (DUF1697 family)
MTTHIVLLRGVNIVRNNRVSMPELRTALEGQGFRDVRTYVQSGNVVLSSRASADRVAGSVGALIKKRFGLNIAVIARSRDELAAVVRSNPLRKIAADPKRYLVTFMSAAPPDDVVQRMRSASALEETFVIKGREVYSWHPQGVGRSPLWERLAGKALGVSATSRNWTTVTTLLAMADGRTAR